MHLPWNARRPIVIVALALAAIAFAQAPAYENPALGFRLVPPAGWAASEDLSPDGMLLLQFAAPSGQGAVGLVAVPILEVDRAFWMGPREALVQDVWEGFLPEVPDAQITQSYEVVVDGAPASVIDFASPSVAGTIVIVVGDVTGFTFFSVGDRDTLQTAQGGLEALVAGFSFLRAGGSASGMGGLGVAPPLDTVGTTGARNPLDGVPSDPHVGVFADERLRLTLEPAADGLAGEVVFDGARFPVIARAMGGGVGGHFLAGGTSYAFEATLAGDTLTFVTDDARYVLQRVR